jgi:iron(III) transport system ATP-binding protein
MADLLKIDNIRCLDAAEPIHTPLSLSLKEGETSVILTQGCRIANTLLRAIQGQIPLDSGKIVLAGDHISNPGFQMPANRRRCSLVSSHSALIPHLTARENIALALRGLKKREHQERLQQVLAEVDLNHAAEVLAAELSQEEQQRTSLARALASDPRMLLWEEPFDPYPESHHLGLVEEIEQIVKERDLTCLITTASIRAGFALARRLGVFLDDRLLQWDEPAKIYHSPAHREVARATGNGILLEGFIQADNTLSSELGSLRFSQDNDWIRTGKAIEFLLRPEHVRFDKRSPKCAVITRKRFQGGYIDYRLLLEEGSVIPVSAPSQIDIARGKNFCFRIEMSNLMVFRPDAEEPVDLGRAYSI